MKQPEPEVKRVEILLPDGSVCTTTVKVYPAAWAPGASRQIHGRKKNLSRPHTGRGMSFRGSAAPHSEAPGQQVAANPPGWNKAQEANE